MKIAKRGKDGFSFQFRNERDYYFESFQEETDEI